jgi:hypothetical protein
MMRDKRAAAVRFTIASVEVRASRSSANEVLTRMMPLEKVLEPNTTHRN